MFRILSCLCLVIALSFASQTAFAAKKIALVVGNNIYENFPEFRQLKKAVNDAKSISDTLKYQLEFDVRLLVDSNYSDFNNAIKQVEADIEPGSVVFFYFSGHGIAIDGANYLLPSDVPEPIAGEEQRMAGASIAAEQVIARFQRKGAKAVFAVLDACRDNPFETEAGKSAGGGSGGLSQMDAAEGVFILFAAGVGQTALDRLSPADTNPNSVFTRNLLPLLETDGLSQVDLAKKLYSKVKKEAATVGHKQHPAYYDQIDGYISLGKSALGNANVATAEDPDPADVEVAMIDSGKKDLVVTKRDTAQAQKELDAILGSWKKYQEAGDAKAYVAAGENALAIASDAFGEDSFQFGQANNFMVSAKSMANDINGAIRAGRIAVRIFEVEFGAEHVQVANEKGNLASRLVLVKKFREAEKFYAEALATYTQKNPSNNVYMNMSEDDYIVLAHLYDGMAQMRFEQGQAKEALRMSAKAQNIISALSDKTLLDHGQIYYNYAWLLKRTENCDEAKIFFEKAVQSFKDAKVPKNNSDFVKAIKESSAQC